MPLENPELDPIEAEEWLEAVEDVVEHDGPERAEELLGKAVARAHSLGAAIETSGPTAYVNTIPADQEPDLPGDPELEKRVRSIIRWNAIATVLRANMESSELGGHIASYQSAAMLYEIGFNHFWHAPTEDHDGDLIYIQGHSSPGIYARSFLEGRLSEEQMLGFRQEVSKDGLSSYPHPWLMPGYWQFPTVSMGLGPIMAIHQANFMRYLGDRGLRNTEGRKVWAFLGDGETDEPETLGEIALAGREKLDNLVFVINCNLQRLDGPVYGNGKIIQHLETVFRGAGWNVIKVIWGRRWDPLLAEDDDGLLVARMNEAVDGEYQVYKSRDGAYVRENFFGAHPDLAKRVENMSDEQIWNLNRGGHDARKIYAAYKAAAEHTGQPTVILAKTIKGYGMGVAGEGQNITHQQKKMNVEALRAFRDRFDLDISDEDVEKISFYRPDEDTPEMKYLQERRKALGGYLPQRRERIDEPLEIPGLDSFAGQLKGSGEREISTTMAFVRVLASLLRDKKLGDRVVPIVPDESRTFGMEGMFRQIGIYSHVGQLYEPEDAGSMMFYKESQDGQILQEGINEAGAMSAWIAAATSYANHDTQMIPFYTFYSMFGFQRVGDLIWAAGDSRARGFLLGGTAGRTTLNGEGLQHEDGHSHVLSQTVPNCISYDPAYGYEIAVIVHDGLRRMISEQEDVFFYLTIENENYRHPAIPEGAEEGILRGMHRVREAPDGEPAVRLLGSGAILRQALEAADLLQEEHGLAAEVWSVTSYTELRREALGTDRASRLGEEDPPVPWVTQCLGVEHGPPVVAASDYMKALPDGIRAWVPGRFEVLGTDGFGRSDYRAELRDFFEVDHRHIAVAALHSLAETGELERSVVKEAIVKYGINTDRPDPGPIMTQVKVPDIGDFSGVPVIEILVAVGDEVEAEQGLVTLESDKATMEVPAPHAGVVEELLVQEGDEVSEGDPVAVISGGPSDDGEQDAGESGGEVPADESDDPQTSSSAPAAEPDDIYASPSVRRIARQRGIDLSRIEGTGRKGRITVEDVKNFDGPAGGATGKGAGATQGTGLPGLDVAPWPEVDHAKHGEVERVELSRIKQISGPNLARNWVYIPHVTHQDEADITDLEAFRKQVNSEQDVKVTMVALLLKAVVPVLKQYPEFNSSLDGDGLILKHYYHLGFAADTPDGLLVPVIRDVDKKGLLEVAEELVELSGKAREGKLSAAEMSGATFTISSLGGIGGTGFTPIVNAPQVAILGVTRAAVKPVWDAETEEFLPRLMVPLSLSYDHRVVDGAAAARFCVSLVKVLEDFRRIVL